MNSADEMAIIRVAPNKIIIQAIPCDQTVKDEN